MPEGLSCRLEGKAHVPPEKIHFPSPDSSEGTTRLIEKHEGADLCYGGFGLTGHFAFKNSPPANEPCDDNSIRTSRTRAVDIGPTSMAQMCMGGNRRELDHYSLEGRYSWNV